MEQAIQSFISTADTLRIGLLRWTLSFAFFETAFRDRAIRLFSLFLLSVVLYLPLSLFLPLWVLAIGPAVWGIPHLIASIRFQAYAIAPQKTQSADSRRRQAVGFMVVIWTAMTGFRVYTDVFQHLSSWDLNHPGMVETGFAIAGAIGLTWILRNQNRQLLFAALILIPLTLLLWHLPLATAGLLILAHNFVSFFYWIAAARERRDRVVAIASTIIFALIHIAVLMKVFDGLINLHPSDGFLGWASLDLDQLGHSIAPWSQNASVWYRCVSLYAFGQAIHYFVWLKAIPDLNAPSSVPTSFKSAWNLLKRDLGARPAVLAASLALVPIAVWLMVNYDWTHRLYFACASYHGFMEIAGLGFVVARKFKI